MTDLIERVARALAGPYPDDWQAWLTAPLDELYRFDRPYPAERMRVERTATLWKR